MQWSERAQQTLAWRDNAGKRLADLLPDAQSIPYREWLLRPAYIAANRRRNAPRAILDEPKPEAKATERSKRSERLLDTEKHHGDAF